ncbi:hypothetical protein AAC387_Pa09g2454 [Persea americana]
METQVAAILQEEREERALRKAEMEATKAENMIEHKDDIFSCPKRTWFTAEREKRLIAMAAKAKSLKAMNKAREAGKIMRKKVKTPKSLHRSRSRTGEMQELFQSDMSERKQMYSSKRSALGAARKKSKHS